MHIVYINNNNATTTGNIEITTNNDEEEEDCCCEEDEDDEALNNPTTTAFNDPNLASTNAQSPIISTTNGINLDAAAASSLMLTNYFFANQYSANLHIHTKEEPIRDCSTTQQQRPSSLALFPFIHQQQQNDFQMDQQQQNSTTRSAFYSPSTNYTASTSLYSSEPPTPGSALSYHAAAAYSFSPSALDFGMLWNPHWSAQAALGAAAVAANEVIFK